MKSKLAALAVAMLVGGFALQGTAISASDTKEKAPKKTTIKGEVVDLACYMGEGKAGKSHAQCAIKCASMGIPFGIKDSKGNIYLVLFGNKKAKAEYTKIGNKGGQKVSVTGMLLKKGGLQAILIGPAEM